MCDYNFSINFPDYVSRIIKRLSDRGYDSYAVGGCIRDSVLGRVPHDWDITTAAHPETVVDIFSEGDIHVIGTAGIRHGTVMIKSGDGVCEITTFRSDGDYSDHRRPNSVTFSETVGEDLSRRDFTMNAIAARPDGNGVCVVDLFGGIDDIKNGIIRTVGDPGKRFGEDALRIMRAVRFSAQLGFEVDPDTRDCAVELCDTLAYVSAERITSELWSILSAKNAGKCVTAFGKIFDWLIPGGVSCRFGRYISDTDDPYVRLAMMLDHGGDPTEFFHRMRFPGNTEKRVSLLLSFNGILKDVTDICGCLRAFGDSFDSFAEYYRILELEGLSCGGMQYAEMMTVRNRIAEEKIPYKPNMLALRGGDAISLGIPSVRVGDVLEYLLAEVQKGNALNEKTSLAAVIPEKYKTK